jgi:ABC-type tungstate transport system permease subunit
MGASLVMAEETGAYILTDKATFPDICCKWRHYVIAFSKKIG